MYNVPDDTFTFLGGAYTPLTYECSAETKLRLPTIVSEMCMWQRTRVLESGGWQSTGSHYCIGRVGVKGAGECWTSVVDAANVDAPRASHTITSPHCPIFSVSVNVLRVAACVWNKHAAEHDCRAQQQAVLVCNDSMER